MSNLSQMLKPAVAAILLVGLAAPSTVFAQSRQATPGSSQKPVVSSVEGDTSKEQQAWTAGLNAGLHLPGADFDSAIRLNAGTWFDLPVVRSEGGSGPYAGVTIGWWQIAGEGEAASTQLPAGTTTNYEASGSVLLPAVELGYKVRGIHEMFVPFAALSIGSAIYNLDVSTLGTTDNTSGGTLAPGFILGFDVPFDFGGALQVLLSYTQATANSPEAQTVLDEANIGGTFVGLGYTHRLTTW